MVKQSQRRGHPFESLDSRPFRRARPRKRAQRHAIKLQRHARSGRDVQAASAGWIKSLSDGAGAAWRGGLKRSRQQPDKFRQLENGSPF
jgi:hypothetical protein